MIAVHGGASFTAGPSCSKWCAEALFSSEATVVTSLKVLEGNPYFNCGKGSNLTMQGRVECEAGYMCSDRYRFGAIGCVSHLPYPCEVAHRVASDQGSLGLVSPQVLIGPGAEDWALDKGFSLCKANDLVTGDAEKELIRTKKLLEDNSTINGNLTSGRLDTVGAISIRGDTAEACVSSGGILCKQPGRLGHCTVFGSGIWAENLDNSTIAVSVSGCGEAIVKTDFARSLSRAVRNRSEDMLPVEAVQRWFDCDYVRSPYHATISPEHILAGGILMLQEYGHCELIVFHNTPLLPVAFRNGKGKLKRLLSTIDAGATFKCDSYTL